MFSLNSLQDATTLKGSMLANFVPRSSTIEPVDSVYYPTDGFSVLAAIERASQGKAAKLELCQWFEKHGLVIKPPIARCRN